MPLARIAGLEFEPGFVLVAVVGRWHAVPSDQTHLLACSSSPVHERRWHRPAQPGSSVPAALL